MIIILRQQIKVLVEIILGAITLDDIYAYKLLIIKKENHLLLFGIFKVFFN
jgi:hypothetical protein